jgi:hypothetical protein
LKDVLRRKDARRKLSWRIATETKKFLTVKTPRLLREEQSDAERLHHPDEETANGLR